MNFPLKVFLGLCCILVFSFALTSERFNELLKDFTTHYAKDQHKIYMSTDRANYVSGEDIWFALNLLHSGDHSPVRSPNITYIELFDADNRRLLMNRYLAKDGLVSGAIRLPDSLAVGRYYLRAYTNPMRNYGQEYFYHKELNVVGAFTRTNMSASAQVHRISFYPEGGTLLAGVENRLAIRAEDAYGNLVGFEGEVVDESGTPVSSVSSEHGIGAVTFVPTTDKLTFLLDDQVYDLPKPVNEGVSLLVHNLPDKLMLQLNADEKTTKVHLTVHIRGRVVYAGSSELNEQHLSTMIKTSDFPEGVAEITIMNENFQVLAQRLVYLPGNQPTVKVRTDKLAYKTRELVNLFIELPKGADQGNFTVSVFDQSAEDHSQVHPNHLVSSLLLTSEVPESVRNAGKYYKEPELQLQELDLLLMTIERERFGWGQLDEERLYQPEAGLVLSGHMQKTYSRKPSRESEVLIWLDKAGFTQSYTDQDGRFRSEPLEFYDSTTIVLQANNPKGKQWEMKVTLDDFGPELEPSSYDVFRFEEKGSMDFSDLTERQQVMHTYEFDENAIVLDEVKIESRKDQVVNTPERPYGRPTMELKIPETAVGWSVLDYLEGRIPRRGPISFFASSGPLFMVDGIYVSDLDMIRIQDVESVDVLLGADAVIFGSRGAAGVYIIHLKKGLENLEKVKVGITEFTHPGLSVSKVFQHPNYATNQDDHARPDLRTTLYWNPNQNLTDTISFYTSDVKGTFSVRVEGFVNGKPFVTSTIFNVR